MAYVCTPRGVDFRCNFRNLPVSERNIGNHVELLRRIDHTTAAQNKIVSHPRLHLTSHATGI
jgi:hypothetical protein